METPENYQVLDVQCLLKIKGELKEQMGDAIRSRNDIEYQRLDAKYQELKNALQNKQTHE